MSLNQSLISGICPDQDGEAKLMRPLIPSALLSVRQNLSKLRRYLSKLRHCLSKLRRCLSELRRRWDTHSSRGVRPPLPPFLRPPL